MVVHDVLDDEASCIWHALPYGDVQDVTSSLHHGCDRPTGRPADRPWSNTHPLSSPPWCYAVVVVGENGDGAWRGLVTIVNLIDHRPYIFSIPDLGG